MSVASVTSFHVPYLGGQRVTVEVDVSTGLYHFSLVGLPDKAVEESKDRVLSALKNSGFKTPKTENNKVTVSLSPAHIKKEGSHFDVSIALGYLIASKQIQVSTFRKAFIGELSLSGEARRVPGVLSMILEAKKDGIEEMYVPKSNEEEAELVEGIELFTFDTLSQLVKHLEDGDGVKGDRLEAITPKEIESKRPDYFLDFEDIMGQDTAKRALLIAAVGGHHVALFGPPGTGKTMLARAFVGILPPLEKSHIVEVTSIHTLLGKTSGVISYPPFRSPHHTSSFVSLVGGGTTPRPGEMTLAHRGVLFLDEFPEFDQKSIEALREPLEEGCVSISRAKGSVSFPAKAIIVAAMNPCPCGYMTSTHRPCSCAIRDIERYKKKLSGPIVDRISLWVPVEHVDYETLSHERKGESTDTLREKVIAAKRFAEKEGRGALSFTQTKNKEGYAKITNEALGKLQELAHTFSLSPRGYYKVMHVARSIADLEQSEYVTPLHIFEAFQYRPTIA